VAKLQGCRARVDREGVCMEALNPGDGMGSGTTRESESLGLRVLGSGPSSPKTL